YSALVLHAAGKEITDDAIGNVLESAGIEPDAAKVKALTSSLEGIDIDEAIATTAVAAAPAAAPAEGGAPAGEEKKAKEEEEEEEEEEVSEEEAAAGLGALFG
ncbi:MAG: 50S ribosomal protein P1, partial [Methanomassiliicoccales archaeon]